jgi:putative alpha-1,2-mannosidase
MQWNQLLQRIKVEGERTEKIYFTLFIVSRFTSSFFNFRKDGVYAAIDGTIQKSKFIYNGWAIWDNYRAIPLLSLAYPEKYGAIVKSIANLYLYGKNNWATKHEPSPTVRTEHAIVVLLDSYKKRVCCRF